MPEDPSVFRAPSPDARVGRTRTGRALLAAGLTLLGCLLGACGVPPELKNPPPTSRPTPTPTASATPAPPPTPTPAPTSTPSPTGLVPCAGKPGQEQVTALLRRSANLPRGVRVTFRSGPLCAGDWQYSMVAVSGRELLQAVTRGPANALKLVTAGSDVCSIRVRTEAPTPIRQAACEAAPPVPGGF
jgi:hypothetical protein